MVKKSTSLWCCFPRAPNSSHVEEAIRRHIGCELVSAWIRYVEDINAPFPNTRMTILELALEACNGWAMQLILNKGAKVDQKRKNQHSPVFCACARGYLEGVRLLVAHQADITAPSSSGLTCLLVAAKNKHFAVVSCLLQLNNCGVSEVDDKGYSALHYATVHNHTPTVSRLVQKGAKIDARNILGESPVFVAAKRGCLDALRVLLENGADPNTSTEDGDFALFRAARACNIEAIRILLDNGADTEQKSNAEWTTLQIACHNGLLGPAKLLIERGADISARTPNGLTCLLLAAKNKSLSVLSYLIEQDSCPVDEMDDDDFTVLHHVVPLNDQETTSMLINKGVDINAQTQDGETPAFLATKNSCWNSLRALLEGGADPNISDKHGEFALHIAVKRGNIEAVKMLLKHGADRTRARQDDSTPLDLAKQLDPPNLDIIDTLLHDSKATLTEEEYLLKVAVAEQRLKNLECKVKQCIYCPITLEVMKDPVLAEDGHTYERKAIEKWLMEKQQSPVTRQRLTSRGLIPNLAVRHLVHHNVAVSGDL